MKIRDWEISQAYRKNPNLSHLWMSEVRTVDGIEFMFFHRVDSCGTYLYEIDQRGGGPGGPSKDVVYHSSAGHLCQWPGFENELVDPHDFMISLLKSEPGDESYQILMSWALKIKESRRP